MPYKAPAATHHIALTQDPQGRTAIFGIGTTYEEAIADAAKWGDPSERPPEDVWMALPATQALYEQVKSGDCDRWGQIEVDGMEIECTDEEQEEFEAAAENARQKNGIGGHAA